jgi:hypothetical protein
MAFSNRGSNGIDRIIDLGFAKGTGGSAMHNAMGYVRGGQKW